jgi:hypothetical protein
LFSTNFGGRRGDYKLSLNKGGGLRISSCAKLKIYGMLVSSIRLKCRVSEGFANNFTGRFMPEVFFEQKLENRLARTNLQENRTLGD